MGQFSTTNLFGMTIRESATDGSDFTNPDADYRRLFLGEDGNLHLKDSAGTVTDIGSAGSVATDAIWDAAGDLAVGSGANTAARLAIGAAGGAVSRVNGVVAWNSGTSMPTAAAGDRYWRTDLGLEAYYDGTRWLTTTLYETTLPLTSTTALTATTAATTYFPLSTAYSYWIVTFFMIDNVASGTSSTQYWTVGLYKSDAAATPTLLGSVLSTQNDTYAQWNTETVAIGEVVDPATYPLLRTDVVKVSTPGSLTYRVGMRYRLILT